MGAVGAAVVIPRRRVLGVAGPPGVGKSTYAERLAGRPGTAVLPMDGFHLPQARLVELGLRDRMGAPETFDVAGFVAVLRRLRTDPEVLAPGFDRTIEEPVPDAVRIGPEHDTVIVEGNYLLLDRGGWEHVAPLLDEVHYLVLDDEIRRERLIARHIRFGKPPGAAREWVLRSDEANARLVAATATRATRLVHVD